MMVRRESGHIDADLRDDDAGDDRTDTGDVHQSVDSLSQGFEPLLEPPIDGRDRALDRINLIQMESKQEPVILRHPATQRGLQLVRRRFQLALELSQALWSGLAGDDRLENCATRLAQDVADHWTT